MWFLSHFSLSLWQAGKKTYAMVSGHSSGHSLASELVESHDGHEEIIKVSPGHFPFFCLLYPSGAAQRELLIDRELVGGREGRVLLLVFRDFNTQNPESTVSDFG